MLKLSLSSSSIKKLSYFITSTIDSQTVGEVQFQHTNRQFFVSGVLSGS